MSDRGGWEPGVQYNYGDSVTFEGQSFRIIQPHRSQGDWTPPVTPALWGVIPGGGYQPPQPHYQPPPAEVQQSQEQRPPPPQKADSSPQAPPQGYNTGNGENVSHEDAKKKWYDLDDKKKDALLAGGLAVGLAALGGGAYYAHEKHKKDGEAEKAQAWELQNWIVAARQRTEEFIRSGPRSPATWVYSEYLDKPEIRNGLILGGEEDGKPWYICRAPHVGGLQPGKCRPGAGAWFGFGHEAVHVKQYEALIGDSRGVRWVPMSGRFSFEGLPGRAVEGGHEDVGTPLAIARARAREHQGILGIGKSGEKSLYPGKASPKMSGAWVTVGDKEVCVDDYEVLVYV